MPTSATVIVIAPIVERRLCVVWTRPEALGQHAMISFRGPG